VPVQGCTLLNELQKYSYPEFISSHDMTQVAFVSQSLQKPGLDVGQSMHNFG
jgi:hypothetical protein